MPRKAGIRLSGLIITLVVIIGCSLALAARAPHWFPFDRKDALSEWEEKIFKGRVLYSVRVDRAGGHLAAYSRNSASGIFYKLRFDPKRYPKISWKWKVTQFPDKGAEDAVSGQWIEKDDYAARVYVIFPRLSFNATEALEYIWAKDLAEGTIMTSPYYKNIKLIVIESGANLGQWVYEERNIYEDFKRAFNREPGSVGAIALMTDTDNTISTAEAFYDAIKVGYKDEAK